jgi:hypothetical protein
VEKLLRRYMEFFYSRKNIEDFMGAFKGEISLYMDYVYDKVHFRGSSGGYAIFTIHRLMTAIAEVAETEKEGIEMLKGLQLGAYINSFQMFPAEK